MLSIQDQRPVWRVWVVLWLAAALQTTLVAHWRPFGSHIDLPLLTVVSVALLLGWEMGAAYGLCAGLLTGYFAAFNPGSFVFSRGVAGAVFGTFNQRFSRDNPLAPSLCAAGAWLTSSLIFWIMSPADFIYWGTTETGFSLFWLMQRALTAMLVHAVLILPVHWLFTNFILPPQRTQYL